MLRTPALSTRYFLEISDTLVKPNTSDDRDVQDNLMQIKKECYNILKSMAFQPHIQQALIAASSSMREGLGYIEKQEPNSRRASRAYSSILRYLIRASTRPTPFGLFSGIAIGSFHEETTLQISLPSIRNIRTRPDMSWLLSVIQKIEQNEELLPFFNVFANHAIYFAEGRVIVPYTDVYGQNNSPSIDLRATSVVSYILERTRKPIPYLKLRQDLFVAFPHATEQQIDSVLQQLWKNHFLLSTLRPPLTTSDPTRYILQALHKMPKISITEQLEKILNTTDSLDRIGFGGPVELLNDLEHQQEEALPQYNAQPYQIDAAINLRSSYLHKAVGEEAARGAELLLQLGASPQGPQHLKEYHAAFVEKYGMDVEVPLLELLSPESGLDAPSTYTEPPRQYPLPYKPPRDMQVRDAILSSLLLEVTNDKKIEIELTDQVLKELVQWTPRDNNPAPLSLEIYLQLHAASIKEIDKGEWMLSVAPAVMASGGATFGRFFDLLTANELEKLRQFTRQEELLRPDAIFAELSYLPPQGRAANVSSHPMLRSYEIVVNTTPSLEDDRVIPLDDLVVGVYNHRFYIRSLSHNKEVIACQSHMLSPLRAPNVCRFLLDVAHDSYPRLSGFDWGAFRNVPFLPRVRKGKMVLSLAQWIIKSSTITPEISGDEDTNWFIGLQQWRKQWNVPRYVYLSEFDNRLLLDLENPIFVSELYQVLKKKHIVLLQEMFPDFEHLWLSDEEGYPYIAELVVPLIQKQGQVEQTHSSLLTQPTSKVSIIPSKERNKLPGGEWTYVKLYASPKQQDRIIIGPLQEIAHKLQQMDLIDHWFFLRYADPRPHLRIRFHTSKQGNNDVVLNMVLKWGRDCFEQNIINDIVLSMYEQEIERYGGPYAMPIIEKIFWSNSVVACQLVTACYHKTIDLDQVAIAVFVLDHLFTSWGLDLAARLDFLQDRVAKYEASDQFRVHRKVLIDLLAPWEHSHDRDVQIQRQKLKDIICIQTDILQEAGLLIDELEKEGKLWKSRNEILSSLAHMQHNRFFGINRDLELLTYALWYHTLESIKKRPSAATIRRGSTKEIIQ
ncbi:hypothetical protein KDW_38530 [Dictyobacter vulcani]|uniref:Lantibiotic dehydratase n=2 Tax=Dictyobacter vulcani TaxID=2607529 RepID=A0A5J4KTA8_9CHLR|nr:hypothetical protein KDW_38530 [Dictyobacter vulcani]